MKRLIAVALLLSACTGGGTLAALRAPAAEKTAGAKAISAALEPVPEGGTGTITFGTAYDPDTLQIPRPLTRFKRSYREIAWSADLARGVDAAFVTWAVASQSGSGVEKPLISEEETIERPGVTILANSGDLALLLGNEPGIYVMRYIDSGEILAEGTFTLAK